MFLTDAQCLEAMLETVPLSSSDHNDIKELVCFLMDEKYKNHCHSTNFIKDWQTVTQQRKH